MAKLKDRRIEIDPRWRSREAASFIAQLDTLSSRMFEDLEGVDAATLGWRAGPGHNSAGMLLAHIAIVEVFWLLIATSSYSDARLRKVLGIGMDDDGIPAGARPPAGLRGRKLAYFRRLHDRARRFSKRLLRGFGPADLKREVTRKRKDGLQTINVRWILYHILEHQAGHYGQILLLLHLRRDRPRSKSR